MFKCNLTGATYKYESMNLLELREKLLKQFGLKPWDIYAGYSEKSVIDYKEVKIETSAIDTPWKVELVKRIVTRRAEVAARKQRDTDTAQAEIDRLKAIILDIAKKQTGKELTSYDLIKDSYKLKVNVPVDLQNDLDRANRVLRDIQSSMRGYNYDTTMTTEDLDLLDDELLFVAEISDFGRRRNVVTATTLLEKFDFRQMICILDYCERNNLSNDDRLKAFNVDTTQEYAQLVDLFSGKDYPEICDESVRMFDSLKFGVYKKVPHDSIYSFIVSELNRYAEKLIVFDRDIYNQQVDITPITLNITAEGKFELIDGYKRLLYVNNPELLNIDAPIKVFTELNDKDFIRLLYSANAWKTVGSRRTGAFHDRGFIFALRQRFGVRLEDYFHNSWKDIDLLKLLQIYDEPSKYCLYNKHLVDDLRTLAHLDAAKMSFFKNEENKMYEKIMTTLISTLGEMRRSNLDKEQNAIDFNKFLAEFFSNKALAKKIASKESMSVGGFMDNFINEHVLPELKKALEKALLG